MSWAAVLDGVGLACLVAGAFLSLAAAIGMLRFRDLFSRMHAATKPQVLGVLLTLLGVGLRLRSGLDVGMLVLVGVFQMLTIPVGAHMVARAAYRTGQVGRLHLVVDELGGPGDDGGFRSESAPPTP